MEGLLHLWPPGRMNLSELMAALGRALENPKAGNRGPRKSLEGAEVLASDLFQADGAAAEAQLNQTEQPTAANRFILAGLLS